MTRITDGDLRAYLDDELRDETKARLIEADPEAQVRLAQLRAQREAVRSHFIVEAPSNPHTALRRFNQYAQSKEKIPMSQKLQSFLRPALAGVLSLGMLMALFTLAPVQQAFSAFLALFRVERVTVISFDPSSLPRNFNNRVQNDDLQQLFTEAFTTTGGGEPQTVADAAEASKSAGYTVRLPQGRTPTTLNVQPGSQMSGKVAYAQLQQMLEALNISDVKLSPDLEGATLTLDVGNAVTAIYGSCEAPTMDQGELRRPSAKDPNCLAFMQLPSPKITADPPTIDPRPLGEIMLRLLGQSPEQARALSQTIDWASTLVIPLPMGEADYRDVNVDGVPGTLIVQTNTNTPTYALVWVKDGLLYSVFGFGEAEQALMLGNSLK